VHGCKSRANFPGAYGLQQSLPEANTSSQVGGVRCWPPAYRGWTWYRPETPGLVLAFAQARREPSCSPINRSRQGTAQSPPQSLKQTRERAKKQRLSPGRRNRVRGSALGRKRSEVVVVAAVA